MSENDSTNFTYGLEDDDFDTEKQSRKDSESLKPVGVDGQITSTGDISHNTIDFDYDEYNQTGETFNEPLDTLKTDDTLKTASPVKTQANVDLSDEYEVLESEEEEEVHDGRRFGIQLGPKSQYVKSDNNQNVKNETNQNAGSASVKDAEDETVLEPQPLLVQDNTSVIEVDTSTLLHTAEQHDDESILDRPNDSSELSQVSVLGEDNSLTSKDHQDGSFHYTTDPLYSSHSDDRTAEKDDTIVIVNSPKEMRTPVELVYPRKQPISHQSSTNKPNTTTKPTTTEPIRTNTKPTSNATLHNNNLHQKRNTNTENTPQTVNSNSALSQAIEYSLQLSEDLETLRQELEKAYTEKDQVLLRLQSERSKSKEAEAENSQLRLNVDKAYDEWSDVLSDLQKRCAALQDQIIPAHEMDVLRAAIIAEIEAPYVGRLEAQMSQQDKQNQLLHEKETGLQQATNQQMEREEQWRGAMERLHRESQQRVEKVRAERQEVQALQDRAIQGDNSAMQDREQQNSRVKLVHMERANDSLGKDIAVLTRDQHRVRSENIRTTQHLEGEVVRLGKSNEVFTQRLELLRSEAQRHIENTQLAQEETSKYRSECNLLSSELSEVKVEKELLESAYRSKLEGWSSEQARAQKQAGELLQLKEMELLRLKGQEDVLQRQCSYMEQLHASQVRELKKQMDLDSTQKESEISRLKAELQDVTVHLREVELKHASAAANSRVAHAAEPNDMDLAQKQQVLSSESRIRELQDRVSHRDRELQEMQGRQASEQRINVELSGLLQKKEDQEDAYNQNLLADNRRLHSEIASLRGEIERSREHATVQAQNEQTERVKMDKHLQGLAQRAEQRVEHLQTAKERYKCMYLQSMSHTHVQEQRNSELLERIAALEAYQNVRTGTTLPMSQKAQQQKSKLQSALNRLE